MPSHALCAAVQGKLLKGLGVAWALACSPLLTAGLFALVYLHPSFHVVAAAEVIRKVAARLSTRWRWGRALACSCRL